MRGKERAVQTFRVMGLEEPDVDRDDGLTRTGAAIQAHGDRVTIAPDGFSAE